MIDAPSGLNAAPPAIDPTKAQRIEYALDIGLLGTESLSIVPIAANETIKLSSDWPHPKLRRAVPAPARVPARIRARGSTPEWIVSALASGALTAADAAAGGKRDCSNGLCADGLSVKFIEPVAIYTLSDRALKYGFLFIGITFGCFFLFEMLKRAAHPPGPVSARSDWRSRRSSCCSSALGAHRVLDRVRRRGGRVHPSPGVLPGRGAEERRARRLVLGAADGALRRRSYGLLVSEDNSLLLGSVLVFALVAAAMVITRKLDWYSLGAARA